MAELADALDLGSSIFDVQVQLLLPAPNSRDPNPKPVGEGSGFLFVFGDLGIEHNRIRGRSSALIEKSNDSLAHAEHIRHHTDAILFVRHQRRYRPSHQ